MPAERCRVGAVVNNLNQYYQRDREEKRGGKFVAIPFFVVDSSQAATMTEGAAKVFLARLRSLGVSAWIEDCVDGRHIEFTGESSQSGVDIRTPVAATLDDENSPEARWYVVKPANTPNGPKWFLHIDLPGVTDPQIIYADEPLGVLQRAEDMGFLQHAVKYERPLPQATPARNSSVVRRRPGDQYNDQ
jgi:hypothetical protein